MECQARICATVMLQCTAKQDILTLQCIVLTFAFIAYLSLMSLVGIFINLPLLVTLLLKVVDRNMKCKNTTFHYDLLFVVNVLPILFFNIDTSYNLSTVTFFKVASTIFIFSLSIVETEGYTNFENQKILVFFLISLPLHIFAISVALFLCFDWSGDLQSALCCCLYKLVFILHTTYYRKEKGTYNLFLIELGGGDSVMKKNVGYHIVMYQMKICFYYIVLPVYLSASVVALKIVMMSVGLLLQFFFTYVALKDLQNVRGDNGTVNVEEQEKLRNNIGISSDMIANSI